MLHIKKMTAVLMSTLLAVGTLGMAVSAAETPENKSLYITKKLVMDDAVDSYPDFTFTFEMEQQDSTTLTDDEGKGLTVSTNQVPLTASISYKGTFTGAAGTNNGIDFQDKNDEQTGLRTVTQKIAVKDENGGELTGQDFGHPGIYVYTVTEKTPVKDTDWTPLSDYDSLRQKSATYTILFVVTRNETTNVLSIAEVAALNDKNEKVEAIFENIYQRDDNTPPPSPGTPDYPDDPKDPDDPKTDNYDQKRYAFEISKKVTGDLSDDTIPFSFNLTVKRNATEEEGKTYTGKIVYTSGEHKGEQVAGTSPVTVSFNEVGEFNDDFTLKHNESLVFDDFPVGTGYQVEETVPAGYTATVDYVQGTKSESDLTMTGFAAKSLEILEGNNKVAVENNYSSTPLTGIVTDNLSFILLIVVAAAGMTAYVVLRRRLRSC